MAQSDADRLVREVTNALVALGYRVTQETIVKGTRFDIICELNTPPARPLSVVVECKYRTSGKVPKGEVAKFVTDVVASGGDFDRALMVTNQGYTPAGHQLEAETRTLHLTTLEELYDQLLNPRRVLHDLVEDYEDSDLFGGYVPLSGAFTTAVRGSADGDGAPEEPGDPTVPTWPLMGSSIRPHVSIPVPPTWFERYLDVPDRLPPIEVPAPAALGSWLVEPTRRREPPRPVSPPESADALELLTELLSVEEPTLAVVLADFGAGKSTLLERFRYQLAKQALTHPEHPSPRIPLLFKLRTRASASSFDAFVVRTAFDQLGVDLTVDTFWAQLRGGRFTCLLDGFDEMASRADKHTRHELMRELSPLTEGGSLAVLSCRPSYFVEPDEFNEFIENIRARWHGGLEIHELKTTKSKSFRQKKGASLRAALRDKNVDAPRADTSLGTVVLIELAKWSPREIMAFIEQNHTKLLERKQMTAQEVYDFLRSVYDLRDLVERPILLKMVMETIDHGAIDLKGGSIDIGASQLYEEYTRVKLERDWLKGETRQEVLTPDQRRAVAVQLALQVFESGEQEISIDAVREALTHVARSDPEFRRILSEHSEDVVLTDVCTCAFITRSVGDSSFRFVHKSFAEFFVASEIGDDLKRSTQQPAAHGPGGARTRILGRIASARYSPEILYFLGGLAFADDQMRTVLRGLMVAAPGTVPDDLRFNVHNSLFSAGPVLRELTVVDAELAALRVRRTSVRKSRIESAVFRASELSEVVVEESDLDIELDRCRLSDVTVRKGRTTTLRLTASETHHLRLDGKSTIRIEERSTVQDLDLDACRRLVLTVSSSVISGVKLGRAAVAATLERSQISGLDCRHSVVIQQPIDRTGESGTSSIIDATFEGSAIVLEGGVEITGCRFHACTILLGGEVSFRSCTFRDVVLVTREESRQAVFRDCAFADCSGVGWEPYITPGRSVSSMRRRWVPRRGDHHEEADQRLRRELRSWTTNVRSRIDQVFDSGPAHGRDGGIGRALNDIRQMADDICSDEPPDPSDAP